MARADQERAEDHFDESARIYRDAYRKLSENDRIGLLGEVTLENAITDYRQAQGLKPDDLGLFEEPAVLLDYFVTARTKAHDVGTAEAVPDRIRAERDRLRTAIEALRTESESESESESDADTELEPISLVQPIADRKPSRSSSATVLGVGVVSLAGGIGLIAGGTWNFRRTEARWDERLDALDAEMYVDEDGYLTELEQWRQQWRGTATGLVVGGSLLAAAGVGLTVWGATRMRRSQTPGGNRAGMLMPLVSQDRAGMVISVWF